MASPAPAAPVIDPELPAPLSMGAVLRITMMRRLWYAQTISVFDDFLALFAVTWPLERTMIGSNATMIVCSRKRRRGKGIRRN